MALTGSYKLDAVALLALLLTVLYFYLKRTYSYWERRGVKTLSGVSLLFGNFREVIGQKESMGHFFTRVYRNTSEPFLGVYGFLRPMLLINDPELIRNILIKDFSHFSDRGVYSNEEIDPLSAHLFALTGQKWKNIRAKLTPTFTSGKLKGMFSTLLDCGSTLQHFLENVVDKGELLDVREVAACHSINVIASVGFGIEVDTISKPNHEFRENLRKVFASSFLNAVRFFLRFVAPKLMYTLRIRLIDKDVEDFIISIVKENLEYREKSNVTRNDFFQLLIQLRNGESVDDESNPVSKVDNGKKTLTINEIAAQAFIFFAAGFETSSTTLSYCLYELAKHPEIQQRVQNEIDKVLKEHDGKITYDSVSDMKFLDKCVDETLRKYPVLPMLNRKCIKEYRIPGTNKVIEKDVEVFISVLGLQRNDKYYEEPDKFLPERWIGENIGADGVTKHPYMPFGDGPRGCIGMRLGKMQAKVGLVLMLQNFKYELHESHKNSDMEFDPRHFLLQPRSDIFLHISKR